MTLDSLKQDLQGPKVLSWRVSKSEIIASHLLNLNVESQALPKFNKENHVPSNDTRI